MRIAVLLSLLLLGSCGSSPKTNFFTLEPIGRGQETMRRMPAATRIEVGDVTLPATLDRLALVTRADGGRLNVSDQDRWAAPLTDLTRRTLTQDLRERIAAESVLAPGDPHPGGGVAAIMINVQQFSAGPDRQVTLDVDWSVMRNGKSGQTFRDIIRVPVTDDGAAAVVQAMSRALAQLADRLATSV
jgi:uncharacterized protein